MAVFNCRQWREIIVVDEQRPFEAPLERAEASWGGGPARRAQVGCLLGTEALSFTDDVKEREGKVPGLERIDDPGLFPSTFTDECGSIDLDFADLLVGSETD